MMENAQKNPGAANLTDIPGFLLLGGGVPVKAGSAVIGAIGVAGAPGGHLDAECADAALAENAALFRPRAGQLQPRPDPRVAAGPEDPPRQGPAITPDSSVPTVQPSAVMPPQPISTPPAVSADLRRRRQPGLERPAASAAAQAPATSDSTNTPLFDSSACLTAVAQPAKPSNPPAAPAASRHRRPPCAQAAQLGGHAQRRDAQIGDHGDEGHGPPAAAGQRAARPATAVGVAGIARGDVRRDRRATPASAASAAHCSSAEPP